MDAQEKSAYPTDQQMDELLTALEKNAPEEIKAVLQKRSDKREQSRDGEPREQSAHSEATDRVTAQAAKGTQRYLPWIASAIVGLLVGLGLGVLIGDHMPPRFEKTTNINIRFDTRTGQNCWAGPPDDSTKPADIATLLFGKGTGVPLQDMPLCKNL